MIWREAPSAGQYFNDAFPLYDSIGYPSEHQSLPNKRETYSVEGDNAELRHYLARLGRRSRCFSRWIESMFLAVYRVVASSGGSVCDGLESSSAMESKASKIPS